LATNRGFQAPWCDISSTIGMTGECGAEAECYDAVLTWRRRLLSESVVNEAGCRSPRGRTDRGNWVDLYALDDDDPVGEWGIGATIGCLEGDSSCGR